MTGFKNCNDNTNDSQCENMSDKDKCMFELEKQLHEQYAVNNNSNAGILISLIGSLLLVFSGYGYVLYQYHTNTFVHCEMAYLVAAISSAVMMILYRISIYLGANQRMEQFITIAIRTKHYDLKTSYEQYDRIYPSKYHPFHKSINDFVQGIYNELSSIFIIALYLIVLTLFVIVCDKILYTSVFVCYTLILHLFAYKYKVEKFVRYKDRESEYMKIFEQIKGNRTEEKTSIYEFYITPNGFVVTIIIIFAICLLAAVAFPYVKLLLN